MVPFSGVLVTINKAVYTTALVVHGWAGPVMIVGTGSFFNGNDQIIAL